MIAFADLGEALESMVPEWESLIKSSEWQTQRVEVTLMAGGRPFRVRAHHGAVSVTPGTGENRVSLSEVELVHLLTGYRYVEEVLGMERRILTQAARDFLATLFPKRCAYVWHNDRFLSVPSGLGSTESRPPRVHKADIDKIGFGCLLVDGFEHPHSVSTHVDG